MKPVRSKRSGYALLYVLLFSALLTLVLSAVLRSQVQFRDQNRALAIDANQRFAAECEAKLTP